MNEHVCNSVSLCGQNLYALKVLKSHGLSSNELSNVCRATLVARLTYAAPAWHGFLSAAERARLQAVLAKAQRWGLYSKLAPDFEDIINKADQTLFQSVLSNSTHVLHPLLPPIKQSKYNLRQRAHNRALPLKSSLTERNFIARMIFREAY
jgi:hypothetical protein